MSLRQELFRTVNRRFFFGWTMAGVASVGIFASGPGQSHTFSVFVEPISRDLGTTSAKLATAYGTATLLAAVLFSFAGPFYVVPILCRFLNTPDACATAAAYGSVSAVTVWPLPVSTVVAVWLRSRGACPSYLVTVILSSAP